MRERSRFGITLLKGSAIVKDAESRAGLSGGALITATAGFLIAAEVVLRETCW
jgi:hypothetical protein